MGTMATVATLISCPDMFQLILDEQKYPSLPQGYRFLLKGEVLQEGDLWADMEFGGWEPCLSWKRGEIVRPGGLIYIRKMEQMDNVPLVQQHQLT